MQVHNRIFIDIFESDFSSYLRNHLTCNAKTPLTSPTQTPGPPHNTYIADQSSSYQTPLILLNAQ